MSDEYGLTCLKCESKEFQNRECPFMIEGHRTPVITAAYVCLDCGLQIMMPDQVELFRKKAHNHEQ